ncbi:MAG: hypothetical protein ACFFBD_23555 [Candidatus Hodarchaeota archaeon]
MKEQELKLFPKLWLKKISVMYPRLTFTLTYNEPSLGYGGMVVVENGKFERNDWAEDDDTGTDWDAV